MKIGAQLVPYWDSLDTYFGNRSQLKLRYLFYLHAELSGFLSADERLRFANSPLPDLSTPVVVVADNVRPFPPSPPPPPVNLTERVTTPPREDELEDSRITYEHMVAEIAPFAIKCNQRTPFVSLDDHAHLPIPDTLTATMDRVYLRKLTVEECVAYNNLYLIKLYQEVRISPSLLWLR